MPLEAIEVGPDKIEVFRSQRTWKRGGVLARQDPLEVGILGGIQFREGITRTREDAFSDASFDIPEETRVTSHASHDGTREKDFEQESPPPGVPFGFIEGTAPFKGAALQKAFDPFARMNQRQDLISEKGEITFKFPRASDPVVDQFVIPIPELSGSAGQGGTTLAIKRNPARAFP